VVEEDVRRVSGEQNTNKARRFLRASKFCFLLVFLPEKFKAMEEADNARQNALDEKKTPEQREREWGYPVVRRALGFSLLLVVFAAILGWFGGRLVGWFRYCALAWWIGFLQIAGTGLLLWATLFVRGWEIQTYGGKTLTERVNQWIFRALSFIGTLILVLALSLPQCS
jgi:hypothetical protein